MNPDGTPKMSHVLGPPLEDQKTFWDWHWQHWRERRTVNEWKQKRHETVLTFLSSLQLDDPSIIDVGCGPGWFSQRLTQFGRVTGIDISTEAITLAKARFSTISFILGNLYDFPLPAAHFDVVVSQEVIDHVPDQVAFLKRAVYFLKPRGYLILSCTNKFVMDRLGPGEFPPQPAEHIARYLSLRGLKRLLRRDFQVLRTTSILPVVGQRGILRLINSPKVNRAAELLLPREYLTALKERRGFGYQLLVLAQRKS
jgi:2-polyprenyl-3-methyl-5-hydroxy-6-metoxy-1,4-benzoquinol methylase